jgi:hypothetical protein
MFQLDMPVVLLQPDVEQMSWLSNVDLTRLTGDTIFSWWPKFQFVFD